MVEIATPEQRERAVAYWENVIRPRIGVAETDASGETPHEALARLEATASQPVSVGPELAAKLAGMRQEHLQAAE
jgi:hypothetical protein